MSADHPNRDKRSPMTVLYWILAGLLALQYLYAGAMKIARNREKLRPTMSWVDSVPIAVVKSIGVLEVAGAFGVILPPLTGIAQWLATPAAIGLGLIQVGAIIFHVRIGHLRILGLNVGLLVLAAATAWLSLIRL
jgi:hypothetical protein